LNEAQQLHAEQLQTTTVAGAPYYEELVTGVPLVFVTLV